MVMMIVVVVVVVRMYNGSAEPMLVSLSDS